MKDAILFGKELEIVNQLRTDEFTDLAKATNNGLAERSWVTAVCHSNQIDKFTIPLATALKVGQTADEPFQLPQTKVTKFHFEWVEGGVLKKSDTKEASQGNFFQYIFIWWVSANSASEDTFLLGKELAI